MHHKTIHFSIIFQEKVFCHRRTRITMMMHAKFLVVLAAAALPCSMAFTLPPLMAGSRSSLSSSCALSTEDSQPGGIRVEAGTHEELMYALGVNLARQLGDVRPCEYFQKHYD
jgi:hypothetical protein